MSGIVAWGFDPVTTFSGTHVAAGPALALTVGALALFAAPLLAVAAFAVFLSVVTVSAIFTAVPLAVAYALFRRRDIAGD